MVSSLLRITGDFESFSLAQYLESMAALVTTLYTQHSKAKAKATDVAATFASVVGRTIAIGTIPSEPVLWPNIGCVLVVANLADKFGISIF